jgi:hypothetical protein
MSANKTPMESHDKATLIVVLTLILVITSLLLELIANDYYTDQNAMKYGYTLVVQDGVSCWKPTSK